MKKYGVILFVCILFLSFGKESVSYAEEEVPPSFQEYFSQFTQLHGEVYDAFVSDGLSFGGVVRNASQVVHYYHYAVKNPDGTIMNYLLCMYRDPLFPYLTVLDKSFYFKFTAENYDLPQYSSMHVLSWGEDYVLNTYFGDYSFVLYLNSYNSPGIIFDYVASDYTDTFYIPGTYNHTYLDFEPGYYFAVSVTPTPTPLPTATPSPVPTATPTPLPTATPVPSLTEFEQYFYQFNLHGEVYDAFVSDGLSFGGVVRNASQVVHYYHYAVKNPDGTIMNYLLCMYRDPLKPYIHVSEDVSSFGFIAKNFEQPDFTMMHVLSWGEDCVLNTEFSNFAIYFQKHLYASPGIIFDYVASDYTDTFYIPGTYNHTYLDFEPGYYNYNASVVTPTSTPSPTATPTLTPLPTATLSPVPTATPTATPTPRPTLKPSATPTPMPSFPSKPGKPVPTPLPNYEPGGLDDSGVWVGFTEYEASSLNLLEKMNAKLDKVVWSLECCYSLLLLLVLFEVLRLVRAWSKGVHLK